MPINPLTFDPAAIIKILVNQELGLGDLAPEVRETRLSEKSQQSLARSASCLNRGKR
jgi:hypothetical protein